MISRADESDCSDGTTDNSVAAVLVSLAVAYALATVLALGWLAS
jgi:hypothetical protein